MQRKKIISKTVIVLYYTGSIFYLPDFIIVY